MPTIRAVLNNADISLSTEQWSEPLQVDNKLSNFHTWRDVDEEDEATLRPGIQDISSG
jgi:hypothetical protein